MISDLKGKAVLITGASTGIGAAAARAFAREGCKVAVHYNASRDAAESVAADIKAAGGQSRSAGRRHVRGRHQAHRRARPSRRSAASTC